MRLTEIFPQADYGFHLRFQRGSFNEFFRPSPKHDELIAERRHWLKTWPQTYAALLPESEPLLDETIALAKAGATFRFRGDDSSSPPENSFERCVWLGRLWEPDFLFLRADKGRMRLIGGCLCFPTFWSLQEKMGHPIEFIHGVVPGLNNAIGGPIHGFLTKLRASQACLRANWGLSTSRELNQHPERKLPRLGAATQPNEVWIRVEQQILVSLPITQSVLFGIRIELYRLNEIKNEPEAANGLSRALSTMPEAVAQYKGIAEARGAIISWLEQK